MDFHPESYGKFCSPVAMAAVLESGTLRWSTPTLFNDPFDTVQRLRLLPEYSECKPFIRGEFIRALDNDIPSFSIDAVWAKILSSCCDAVNKSHKTRAEATDFFLECCESFFSDSVRYEQRLFDEVIGTLKTSKLLCLTREFWSLLMWAHYAESHTGGLLGFSQTDNNSPWKMAKEVVYQSDLPLAMDIADTVKICTGQMRLDDPNFVRQISGRAVFSKSSEWAYEKELRIFSGNGRNSEAPSEDLPFGVGELAFVVFGCRADKEFVAKYNELTLAKYPNAKTYIAEKSDAKYGVEFKSLS